MMMLPICEYSFFLSVDDKTNELMRASRNKVEEICELSFEGRPYLPHISVFSYEREENDNTIIKQALPALTDLSTITLFIKEMMPFKTGPTDTIVYIFQNPERVKQLHSQISIAYLQRPKNKTPHITVAKDLAKSNSSKYDSLPSLAGHEVKCASLSILKKLKDRPNDHYIKVHEISLE